MNFSKIKTILIALMLLVNILLGAWLQRERNARLYLDGRAVADTVELLRSRDITIGESVIPRRRPECPVYIVSVNSGWKDRLATAFAGTGGEWRGSAYYGASGSVSFSETYGFQYEAVSEAGGAFEPEDLAAAIRATENLLARLGLSEDGYAVGRASETDAGFEVMVKQTLGKYELLGFGMTVGFSGGRITSASGLWLIMNVVELQTAKPRDVTDPLLTFAAAYGGGLEMEITGAGIVYWLPDYPMQDGKATLSPKWSITTGAGARYYYDAISGSEMSYGQ